MYFYHKENRILLVKKRSEEVLSRYLIVSAMADKQIRISAHGEYFEGGKMRLKNGEAVTVLRAGRKGLSKQMALE